MDDNLTEPDMTATNELRPMTRERREFSDAEGRPPRRQLAQHRPREGGAAGPPDRAQLRGRPHDCQHSQATGSSDAQQQELRSFMQDLRGTMYSIAKKQDMQYTMVDGLTRQLEDERAHAMQQLDDKFMKLHLDARQEDALEVPGEKRKTMRPDPVQQQQTLEERWSASKAAALPAVRRQRERAEPADAPPAPPRRIGGDEKLTPEKGSRTNSKANDPMEVEQAAEKATRKEKPKGQIERRVQAVAMEVEVEARCELRTLGREKVADKVEKMRSSYAQPWISSGDKLTGKGDAQQHRTISSPQTTPAKTKQFSGGAERFYLDVTGSRRREQGATTGPSTATMKAAPKVQRGPRLRHVVLLGTFRPRTRSSTARAEAVQILELLGLHQAVGDILPGPPVVRTLRNRMRTEDDVRAAIARLPRPLLT